METAVEQRFERIERNLEKITEAHLKLIESFGTVAAAQLKLVESVGSVAESVGAYVASSEARMKRLEENLDGLIRAITREHGNGKAGK